LHRACRTDWRESGRRFFAENLLQYARPAAFGIARVSDTFVHETGTRFAESGSRKAAALTRRDGRSASARPESHCCTLAHARFFAAFASFSTSWRSLRYPTTSPEPRACQRGWTGKIQKSQTLVVGYFNHFCGF